MKRISLVLSIFTMLFVGCESSKKATTPTPSESTVRKDVETVTGTLTLHPIQTELQTKDDLFLFVLDGKEKTLYMTTDQDVYDTIGKWLPLQIVPGRSVMLEGTFINPFTEFTPEQFDEINTKMKKLGVELNGYKLARMFNCGLAYSEPNPSGGKNKKQSNKIENIAVPEPEVENNQDTVTQEQTQYVPSYLRNKKKP